MALILSRQVGQVVYANETTVTVTDHNMVGGDKVATISIGYPDGSTKEEQLSLNNDNRVTISSEPYAAVSLGGCTKHAARLRFHGDKEEVTFLRAELKGE